MSDVIVFADRASKPKAFLERVDRQNRCCQVEVGHGVQR